MKLLSCVALCLVAGCDSRAVIGARIDLPDAGAVAVAVDAGPTCGSAVATQVAAGGQFSCALMAGGTVTCWGGNFAEQLGDGLTQVLGEPAQHHECHPTPMSPEFFDCSLRPVDVVGITDAIAISAEGDIACALHADHHVSCWGSWGASASSVPVDVPGLTDATAIAVNLGDTACALASTGEIACWGNDPTPTVVVSGASALAGSCAIVAGGVTCWSPTHAPTSVAGITTAVALAPSCALLADGTVTCWEAALVATPLAGLTGVTAIADTCAQKADGTMWCWTGGSVAAEPAFDGASSWSTGGAHECAVLPGGAVCRGRDDSGEVGNGINLPTSALAPVCW